MRGLNSAFSFSVSAAPTVDVSSPLFSCLPQIVSAIHFLYEELKLDKSHLDNLQYIAGLLTRHS
jgi:hypothetical protein